MSQISDFSLIVDPAVYRDVKWGLQPAHPDENIKKACFSQPAGLSLAAPAAAEDMTLSCLDGGITRQSECLSDDGSVHRIMTPLGDHLSAVAVRA